MTRWEYGCEEGRPDKVMFDKRGAEGWELVGFDSDGDAWFKRHDREREEGRTGQVIKEETFTEREKLIASIAFTRGHAAALEGVSRAMRESATNAAADGLQDPFIAAVLNGFADSLDRVIESNKGRTVDPAAEQVSP